MAIPVFENFHRPWRRFEFTRGFVFFSDVELDVVAIYERSKP